MPSLRSGIIVRGSLTPRVLLRYEHYDFDFCQAHDENIKLHHCSLCLLLDK